MKTSYDDDILKVLNGEIATGLITVRESSEDYFSALADAFPLAGSRIDWDAVPGAVEDVASSVEELDDFSEFFERVLDNVNDNDLLTYVGDSLTSCAYIGKIATFRAHLDQFLSIPQHHYFIGPECRWCIVFTFEGDMGFGRAPGSVGEVAPSISITS